MKKYSIVFVSLVVLFCVSLIVSNVISGKLWDSPFGVLTGAVLLFPIVYIIGDVMPEVYGLGITRRVILLGFFANLTAVVFFMIAILLTPPKFFVFQSSYETVLGITPRILLASFVAYLAGTNSNAYVLTVIKKFTNGKFLWMRTIGSTIIGESIDSVLFMTIAFYGVVPNSELPSMILLQAGFKTMYEVIATPLTYLVINKVKKYEYGEIDCP